MVKGGRFRGLSYVVHWGSKRSDYQPNLIKWLLILIFTNITTLRRYRNTQTLMITKQKSESGCSVVKKYLSIINVSKNKYKNQSFLKNQNNQISPFLSWTREPLKSDVFVYNHQQKRFMECNRKLPTRERSRVSR